MKSGYKLSEFTRKYSNFLSVAFFCVGFAWDWFTIDRIDSYIEMSFLVGYFFILTILTYLSFTYIEYDIKSRYKAFLYKYLPLAIQFLLGGLCSTFVIFFSRSVSISKTSIFFILIGLILLVNEFFRKKLTIYIKFIIYSFVSYLFMACLLPTILSTYNSFVFYLSGLISISVCVLLLYSIHLKVKNKIKGSYQKLIANIVAVHVILSFFYFLKIIPPVPLALTESFVATNIKKVKNTYEISYQPKEWYNIWDKRESTLKFLSNENIFVFTSIFSPNNLDVRIQHRWKQYNANTQDWETTDIIEYEIQGGREDGYRGYTYKSNISEGEWKVEVLTNNEIIIGVIKFIIVIQDKAEDRKVKIIKR